MRDIQLVTGTHLLFKITTFTKHTQSFLAYCTQVLTVTTHPRTLLSTIVTGISVALCTLLCTVVPVTQKEHLTLCFFPGQAEELVSSVLSFHLNFFLVKSDD